jgi:phosphopantothenoylcysteine decarboxylase / phosphopantothenate---cysteine ligase
MPDTTNDILCNRRIVLGVTGGIAAFKAAGLVTALRKRGAEVRVVMTEAATWFVTPTTFATLSGNEVGLKMFGAPLGDDVQHVHLQDFAEVMLIAPATADILGKVAGGLADDLLTTVVMALHCPIIFAPAMNVHMWANPIVQRNVRVLREFGYGFVMPESGRLASGAEGAGRLACEEHLVAAVERALQGALPRYDLENKKIVVSAGPTREPLDPVRFLSNRSTGRMGYALAAEAEQRGAQVILVTGPTELSAPPGVEVRPVTTSAEMKQAVLEAVPGAFAYISAAAPADYRPAEVSDTKIKKGEALSLALEQTDDILLAVGAQARPQVLVGFAAETGDAVATARPKLARKDLDLLVVNDVNEPGSGFAVDTNRVSLLSRDGSVSELPLMSKAAVAAAILDSIALL